ncbi:MAG TPA: addiction module protein [Thermoanaerobaculia bacterium]|nr:addiction module protein [Thermoanaerobaculia bacterium]
MRDLASILALPTEDRLRLIEAIWDSLTEVPEAVPVSDELKSKLDRRLDSYHANRTAVRPWGEVRAELFDPK